MRYLIAGSRLLTAIALIVLVAVAASIAEPRVGAALGSRPGAVWWAAFGAAAVMGLTWLYTRVRLRSLVAAAQRLAAGDLDVRVGSGGDGIYGGLADAINGIARTLAETHAAATVDRLTGVNNRQALVAELLDEVGRANRYDRPLSLAFVDIDHFKQVNDTHGHHAGDVVLRGVAQTLRANLRATDIIGRYGGEEFMLLLTETRVDDAAALAEKLRSLVERARFAVDGRTSLGVTVSIGIASGQGAQVRMDTLVRDADAAMYSAKSLGRNQTYIFAEPDEDARVPRAAISAAGRALAHEVGESAREAAQAVLASVIAPLPHRRGQPSALIATIVMALANKLDLPPPEVDRIRVAALLHDVGTVAVPESILEKPSALTSVEWQAIVQHPRIGQVILEQATALRDAVPIILHHHERFAGHGYPYGLRGSDIPLGARIVAIADAYDAMVHERPYKRAIGHESAIRELRRHAGTQFDPELVQLFCELYAHAAPVPDPTIALVAKGAHPSRPGARTPDLEGSPSRSRPRHSTVDPAAAAG
jgi:diguanylate cyclase (GGDEF)-like protein